MSAAFQDELHFLGIESSPAFVRAPEGYGCAERFTRTLKENLLWVRRFETIEELRQALQTFRETYSRASTFVVPSMLLGQDLTRIHGLGPSLALKLVAECGTDLAAWPSSKNFTSWLCLAPGSKISGGKVLSSRTRRSGSRAAALLRLAAVTVGKTEEALCAFTRACQRGSARPKPSRQPPARSRCCSTTPCVTAWIIRIRERPTVVAPERSDRSSRLT